MKLGAPLFGSLALQNRNALRDFVLAVEDIGYDYLLLYQHLLEPTPERVFHEAFTLFSYLAALTDHIELATGVMILPKRSTVLVAKQAAEVDLLSNGRLRLGVGVGWNEREYQALGFDFHNRGQRMTEQIDIMRQLWTHASVTYDGQFHHLDEIGISVTSVQQPIPIWIGGMADAALQRAAFLGDGWMAYHERADFEPALRKVHQFLGDAHRNRAEFGISSAFFTAETPEKSWRQVLDTWEEWGVSHVECVPSLGIDVHTVDEYLSVLKRFKAIAG